MKKEHILIVEDEWIVANDIKVCLKRLGYEVAGIAISGVEALKKAEKLKPDLVLMDIVLEGRVNGIDAAAKLRSRFNIPVVYLTAYSDIITVDRAKKTEPYGYILKPFDDRDLHSTIEMALYKHTMENMLRESEAFNFALFQYNPIETIVVDNEGKVKKINMAKRKSGDRLPNIGDVMYKDYARKHEIDMFAELLKCIKAGKKKDFPELKYGDKFLNITIAPFSEGAIITAQDVSERKKAEEEYENIFNLSPDMVAVCTTEGKFLKVNPSWEKVLGYTQKEVLDQGWAQFVHPDDVERTNKEVEKQLKGSSVVNFINRFKSKDGSYKTFEWQATYAKEGIVHATARDVTERMQMEEALRKSEKQFRISLETLLDGFAIFSAIRNKAGRIVDFRYEYINKSGCKLNKKTYKEQVGHTLLELLPAHKDTGLFHEYMQVVETGKPLVRESLIYEDIFGVNRRLSRAFDLKAVKFDDGFAVTWRNVTESKRVEEEIKSSREELRDLTAHLQSIREQERTVIAREMHDELGQSLTALKMDLSWLDRKTPKDQKPLVDRIISMRKLIDSTLQTVKRISTDLRPELLDDLGLSAAIEWQGEEFQNRTGIKTKVTMDPEEIILDQERSTAIFRIFQEALTNVARHSNATRVSVNLKMKTSKIDLKVKDNGKGITEKQISGPKSFGLIGIRERIHFLEGEVNISGVQDKGTTVTVSIPIPKEGNAG